MFSYSKRKSEDWFKCTLSEHHLNFFWGWKQLRVQQLQPVLWLHCVQTQLSCQLHSPWGADRTAGELTVFIRLTNVRNSMDKNSRLNSLACFSSTCPTWNWTRLAVHKAQHTVAMCTKQNKIDLKCKSTLRVTVMRIWNTSRYVSCINGCID